MGLTGKELGADIYDLFHAGNALMPAMAGVYRSAKTDLGISFSLTRDDSLGLGATGCETEMTTCLNAIKTMLGSNATAVDAVGAALVSIARDEYAESDAQAQAEYRRLGGKL